MTKREFFNTIIATVDNADLKAFAEKEIAMLDRKNATRSSKPTKTQVENAQIKDNLLGMLEGAEPMTVGAITSAYNEKFATDFSSNKINALITQLKGANLVSREVIKRVAYFKAI